MALAGRVLVGVFLAAGGVGAQGVAPSAGGISELSWPTLEHTVLSNGAAVIRVPGSQGPLVSVSLVVPSGSATDPAGMEGMAVTLATLLGEVPVDYSGVTLGGALDRLGASLSAEVAADFLRIDLRTLTSQFEAAVETLAPAVISPTLPVALLERQRAELLRWLEGRAADPARLAGMFFQEEVYGDHPYGRQPTRASARDLDPDDLRAWHADHVRPRGATFIVAGDVELGRAAAALESAFAGWEGGGVQMDFERPLNRASPEVILVDQPGLGGAWVRVGHLLPESRDGDWPLVQVATRFLASGRDGPVDPRPRVAGPGVQDAFARAGRRVGRGFLELGFTAETDAVSPALDHLLDEVERLRDLLLSEEELDRIRTRILGRQLLALETPMDVASDLARVVGLGLGPDAAPRFRARVSALTPEALRSGVRSNLRPGEMVIVVVGDARQLETRLEPFGPVRVVDPAARAREVVAGTGVEASQEFSGEALEPVTAEYGVFFQGRRAGRTRRTLEVLEDSLLRFGTTAALGSQEVSQSVTARVRDLAFVSSEIRVTSMGRELGGSLVRRGDRITGTLRSPGAQTPVDVAAGDDVLVADMLELAVWVAELEVGTVLSLPVLDIQAGSVERVVLEVEERRDDLMDAEGRALGDVFVIQVRSSEPQTLFARVEAPHVVVLLQPGNQPVDVQLESLIFGVTDPAGPPSPTVEGGGAGPPGG